MSLTTRPCLLSRYYLLSLTCDRFCPNNEERPGSKADQALTARMNFIYITILWPPFLLYLALTSDKKFQLGGVK